MRREEEFTEYKKTAGELNKGMMCHIQPLESIRLVLQLKTVN